MKADELIAALERNGCAILALYEGVPAETARWRPAPEKWSLLEILNHLCDEERGDFRRRLELVLRDPEAEWPPWDPEKLVTEKSYNTRRLAESLDDFRNERMASLEWLRALKEPDWGCTKRHPKLGPLSAGDLLAAWTVHDVLHIRQIANTQIAWITEASKPHSTRYAMP